MRQSSYAMIQELDRWGVKFEKDETGDFDVRKVHHMGSLRAADARRPRHQEDPLPAAASAAGWSHQPRVATRLLTGRDGRVAGVIGLRLPHRRFLVIRAKA